VPPVYVFDGPWPWLPYAHPAALPRGPPLHARALPRLREPYPADALPPPPPPHAPPLWPALGYVLSEADFNASLRLAPRALPELRADAAGAAAWRAKRAAIEAAREAHFTYAGVVARIREWIEDPWNASLFCARPVPPAWDAWITPLPCCAAASGKSNASSATANNNNNNNNTAAAGSAQACRSCAGDAKKDVFAEIRARALGRFNATGVAPGRKHRRHWG
jgi:hypothetical protein